MRNSEKPLLLLTFFQNNELDGCWSSVNLVLANKLNYYYVKNLKINPSIM